MCHPAFAGPTAEAGNTDFVLLNHRITFELACHFFAYTFAAFFIRFSTTDGKNMKKT